MKSVEQDIEVVTDLRDAFSEGRRLRPLTKMKVVSLIKDATRGYKDGTEPLMNSMDTLLRELEAELHPPVPSLDGKAVLIEGRSYTLKEVK